MRERAVISEAMSRCLKLLRSNPCGVNRWPLGSVGLTLKMATKCRAHGYASATYLADGTILFRLTPAGASALEDKIQTETADKAERKEQSAKLLSEYWPG